MVKLREIIEYMFYFFRDTAGQERFRTITTAYYRGAMVCLYNFLFLLVCKLSKRSEYPWGFPFALQVELTKLEKPLCESTISVYIQRNSCLKKQSTSKPV